MSHSASGVPARRSRWGVPTARDFWERAACAAWFHSYVGQLNVAVAQVPTTQPRTSQRLICSEAACGIARHEDLHAHTRRRPWMGLPGEVAEASTRHDHRQPPVADPALRRGVGPSNLQRCLQPQPSSGLHFGNLAALWREASMGDIPTPPRAPGHRAPPEEMARQPQERPRPPIPAWLISSKRRSPAPATLY